MPRFDGPYEIMEAFPESSSYKLLLPPTSKSYSTFHVAQLRTHVPNDDKLFPGCVRVPPKPLVMDEGTTEYFIEKILNCHPQGRGNQFLVCWSGYGPEHNLWLPQSELLETKALTRYESEHP